jgi:hypothetical protein
MAKNEKMAKYFILLAGKGKKGKGEGGFGGLWDWVDRIGLDKLFKVVLSCLNINTVK